jgi:hypothetical protein
LARESRKKIYRLHNTEGTAGKRGLLYWERYRTQYANNIEKGRKTI